MPLVLHVLGYNGIMKIGAYYLMLDIHTMDPADSENVVVGQTSKGKV